MHRCACGCGMRLACTVCQYVNRKHAKRARMRRWRAHVAMLRAPRVVVCPVCKRPKACPRCAFCSDECKATARKLKGLVSSSETATTVAG